MDIRNNAFLLSGSTVRIILYATNNFFFIVHYATVKSVNCFLILKSLEKTFSHFDSPKKFCQAH